MPYSKDFEVLIEEDRFSLKEVHLLLILKGKIVAYEVNAGNVGRNAGRIIEKSASVANLFSTHGR